MLGHEGGEARADMTYSIVAHDPDTGEFGVAVATGGPAVGAMVPWVEPGVGAVATQSFTNMDLGPLALARLREGHPAPVALRALIEADPSREVRQIGVVDVTGTSAAFTGRDCVAEAGHVLGSGVSAQANMVERADTWLAMQVAFSASSGDLADRMLQALRVAEREGGDIRGTRSAALVVSPGAPASRPWVRRFDLRVDLSANPLDDLTDLLRGARAFEAFDAAFEANRADDVATVLDRTTEAYALEPGDARIGFWHAMALLANGHPEEARPVLVEALEMEPRMAEFARRYVEAGHGGPLTAVLDEVGNAPLAAPLRPTGRRQRRR